MEWADQEEGERRQKEWNWSEFRKKQKPLRPLPETRFWEEDIVTVKWVGRGAPWEGESEFKVLNINYNYLDQKRLDGSPMPEYNVTPLEGESWSCCRE